MVANPVPTVSLFWRQLNTSVSYAALNASNVLIALKSVSMLVRVQTDTFSWAQTTAVSQPVRMVITQAHKVVSCAHLDAHYAQDLL